MAANTNAGTGLSLKWLYLAWISLAFTCLAFMVFGMLEQGDPTPRIERVFGDATLFALGTYIVGQLIALIILSLLLKKNNLTWQVVGLRGRLTKQAVMYAVLGWIVAFFLFYVIEKIAGSVGLRMFWNEGDFLNRGSMLHVVLISIGTIIIAPVVEEIIYRGYILSALMAKFRTSTAVILSALIFGSIHVGIGPGLAIYIFLGAFIPAWLFLRFDSIYPCILMHFINNIVVYLVIPFFFG